MLAPTGGTTLAAAGTKVPMGMRVKWYQRAWELYVEIEGPDLESPEVSITDDGQLVMRATVAGLIQTVCLKFLHGVKSKECRCRTTSHSFLLSFCADRDTRLSARRWVVSTRSVKFDLPKSGESRPHWDRLTVGEKLPNIVIDWGSWMDEEEEAEVRAKAQLQSTSSPRTCHARASQIRANPYGHDVKSLAGAMGRGWGSNTEMTMDARRQAAAVDTSNPDDPEDDICMA
eukprot:7103345-Prymnesium_polylepis.1